MDLLRKPLLPSVYKLEYREIEAEDGRMTNRSRGEGKRTDPSNSGGNSVSIPDRHYLILADNKRHPFPLLSILYRVKALAGTQDATVTRFVLLL